MVLQETELPARVAEKPSDHVRGLLWGIPSSKLKEWSIVVLDAAFDDSGSGGDSKYFVLAGYRASQQTWVSFTDTWRYTLDADPAIDYFKMSEAESRRGQFAGFTEAARDAKLSSLIEVIRAHDLTELSCAIPQAPYDELIKGRVPEKYDSPYFFCFGIVLRLSTVGCDRQKVNFVFDSNQRLEKPSKLLYELSKHLLGYREMAANIDYRDDKEFLPLQAADLIAWQTRRFLCVEEGTRAELRRLHEDRVFHRVILKQSELEKLLATMLANSV